MHRAPHEMCTETSHMQIQSRHYARPPTPTAAAPDRGPLCDAIATQASASEQRRSFRPDAALAWAGGLISTSEDLQIFCNLLIAYL